MFSYFADPCYLLDWKVLLCPIKWNITCLFCRLSHLAFLFSALLNGRAFPFWFKWRGVKRLSLKTRCDKFSLENWVIMTYAHTVANNTMLEFCIPCECPELVQNCKYKIVIYRKRLKTSILYILYYSCTYCTSSASFEIS